MNTPIASVFDLTRQQLQPIVESAASDAVMDFDITIEHSVKGPCGIASEKVIPTFRYLTRLRRECEVVIFAKRRYESGPADARQYEWLREYDAPIPRMYGHMSDAEGREIIFLEHLDVVTEPEPCERFLNDAAQFPDFVRAMARLNAIRAVGEYARGLAEIEKQRRGGPNDWRERLPAVAKSLDDIWLRSRRGDLGEPMRTLCDDWRNGATTLGRFVTDLLPSILAMARGLNHCDLYPFHAGRRPGTGEMLLFDLEDTGHDARFYDASLWLGAPDEVQQRCAPRRELAECYLAEYAARGGSRVCMEQFLAETSTLWRAGTAWSMYLAWWSHRLLEKGDDPRRVVAGARDRAHGMATCRNWMHRELSILRSTVECDWE
jgi:hypothetical protein